VGSATSPHHVELVEFTRGDEKPGINTVAV
jgi:hypothetical protein